MNQRRSHHKIIAGNIEVELLHQFDRVEILLRDEGDRDVMDAQLVLLDEVQQEIERPLELFEPDREGVDAGLEILLRIHQPAAIQR